MENKEDISLQKMLYSQLKKYLLDDNDYQLLMTYIKLLCSINDCLYEDLKIYRYDCNNITFSLKNKVIKITNLSYSTDTLSDYVINSKWIQQPNYEFVFNFGVKKITILELDLLDISNIGINDIIKLYNCLRSDGYLWSEPLTCNMGRGADGLLRLSDYSGLVYIGNMNKELVNFELKKHSNNVEFFDKEYKKTMNRSKK